MTDSPDTPEAVCQTLLTSCAAHGFDLMHPLQIGWYNDAVDNAYRVPDFGRRSSLAIVIANSRALWGPFRAARRRDPELAAARDPLDRYTERILSNAVESMQIDHELRFSHEPPPRRVAMQRLAHVAGFAYLSRSHLSIHPTVGPWFGLRALVIFDMPGPTISAPECELPCVCDAHCLEPLRVAMNASADMSHASVEQRWRLWLAVRDACPVGRAYRYDDEQIRYHYTKDKSAL